MTNESHAKPNLQPTPKPKQNQKQKAPKPKPKPNPKKPAYPDVYYYSKSSSTQQRRLRTTDLPPEPGAIGIYSRWALLWGCLFAIVPVAYLYILLILLRECSVAFPGFAVFLQQYAPPLAALLLQQMQQQKSRFLEAWCILEAVFYVALKLHIRYLETRDPLEQSLSSAPLMKHEERALLWKRIMDIEKDDPAALITGWFFDQPIHKISRYDAREFITWCMFEGRNQEHLTGQELRQLHDFLHQLELSISLHWYGAKEEEMQVEVEVVGQDPTSDVGDDDSDGDNDIHSDTPPQQAQSPVPKKRTYRISYGYIVMY